MASKVEIKTIEELSKMHTGTLMARRKALLKCEESSSPSDREGNESEERLTESEYIEYKDSPQWQEGYKDLKTVLSTRENLPNKQQRKAIRQSRASK